MKKQKTNKVKTVVYLIHFILIDIWARNGVLHIFWGEGGFGQHLTGKRLVAVCDGARDAVKFQETGRIGGHSCMRDLGRPPVDQGIRE